MVALARQYGVRQAVRLRTHLRVRAQAHVHPCMHRHLTASLAPSRSAPAQDDYAEELAKRARTNFGYAVPSGYPAFGEPPLPLLSSPLLSFFARLILYCPFLLVPVFSRPSSPSLHGATKADLPSRKLRRSPLLLHPSLACQGWLLASGWTAGHTL